MYIHEASWLVRSRKVQMIIALLLIVFFAVSSMSYLQIGLPLAFSLLLLEGLFVTVLRRRWWNQAGECRHMSLWEKRILLACLPVAGIFLVLGAHIIWKGAPIWPFVVSALLLWSLLALSEFWAAIHLLSRRLLLLLPSRDKKREQLTTGGRNLTVSITSEEDIVQAVLQAKQEERSVRAVGSRCSSVCYRASGASKKHLQLDLTGYDNVISFEPHKRSIHVQAGMLQSKLCSLLKSEGLALPALNGSGQLTVGGTISTGSICGSRFLLSDCIQAITLVNADARVVRIHREQDADVFGAYLCSLGLLGVISSIEYKLVPAFVVQGDVKNISFEDMLDLSEPERSNSLDYAIHDWYPLVGRVISRQLVRLPNTETLGERRVQPSMTLSESFLGQLFTALVNQFPWLKTSVMKLFVALFKPSPVEAWWDELITVDPEMDLAYHPIEYLEVVVKRSDYRAFMQELHDFYQRCPKQIPFVPIITDWIAPDKVAWLSKNSAEVTQEEPFAAITVAYQLIEKNAGNQIFQPVIELAKKYKARMHWGKFPWMKDAQSIGRSLPDGNFERFVQLRREQDPEGRFMTTYFQSLFS